MGNPDKYLNKYHGDKFEVENISSLSLFLYDRVLSIVAKNESQRIMGANVYSFSHREDVFDIIESDNLINSQNILGKFFIHNDRFCLVPSLLFDPSHKDIYLGFSSEIEPETLEIFYEGIHSNKLQVVGAVEKQLLEKLDTKLPELEVVHGSALVLSYLLDGKKDMMNQELLVLITPDHIYLSGFREGELKVFNRFKVFNDNDFLKYTFAVLHQLAFNRMHCKITLMGDLEYIHCSLDTLGIYFKNLVIETPISNQNYLPGAEAFKSSALIEAFWSL